MNNLWTKLKSWFKPKPKKPKFIKPEAKKDQLTFEQRLKRGELIIEKLTKEEKC